MLKYIYVFALFQIELSAMQKQFFGKKNFARTGTLKILLTNVLKIF